MSIGSKFQTFRAATLNARFAVSVTVRVLGTNSRRASVDRSDRIVSWRCSSSSRYGGTDVDKALYVMTATLYRIRCCIGSQCNDFNGGLALARLRHLTKQHAVDELKLFTF